MEAGRSQDVAEEAAGGLLAAELEHPFEPDVEVHKIGGKVFLPSTRLRVDARRHWRVRGAVDQLKAAQTNDVLMKTVPSDR
ncbi:hypothetical protein QFW96_00030 [Saccharopolyspora sp. TS4A08]|uniref:BON domain-containing protein n=1 Tax=Saccharopolyspora ipomoeae TaxID=3042027 RepID=A0ABT6PG67_9PSEU|nr:hypothetical protein [Saccharopolyspora sp. TS4A08]MDI2026969.1 hypothetical protein [Saccharopolyspora sp. TS4A08]